MPKVLSSAPPLGNETKKAPPTRFAARGKENAEKEIAEAIRALLEQASSFPEPAPTDQTSGHRVLLDIEVDGVRCLLIEPVQQDPDRHPMVLSPREQEVARMVAKGYPNKTIAAVLEISTWTVGTYVRRIFAKLGVGCRAAMVAKLQEINGGGFAKRS